MDRQQMLTILNTMSDDNLMNALGAVGIEGGNRDWQQDDENGLSSWGQTDVKIAPPNKPQFLDTSKFVEKQQVEQEPNRFPAEMYQKMHGEMGQGMDDYAAERVPMGY